MLAKRWRHRQCKVLFCTGLVAVLALNSLAWMHARAMTHFVAGGLRTQKPERLSFGAKVWTAATGVKIPRPLNHRSPKDVGLSYETHNIAIPNGESLEAWFVPSAHSRGVIVMFPPHAASKDSLLAPSAVLHELGYDLLLVDFRGVGGSSGNDTTIGLREADDVALSVAYVQRILPERPIVLYGTSMGAVAIMRAIAIAGVRPAAIVLESPFDRLLNTVRQRFRAMGLNPFPGAELMVFWGGAQQGFNGFAHNPVDYAKAIKCPTLILHGALDRRVTIEEVTAIFKNLRGRKQLVSFADAGHATVNGSRWKQHLAQFLSAPESQ